MAISLKRKVGHVSARDVLLVLSTLQVISYIESNNSSGKLCNGKTERECWTKI